MFNCFEKLLILLQEIEFILVSHKIIVLSILSFHFFLLSLTTKKRHALFYARNLYIKEGIHRNLNLFLKVYKNIFKVNKNKRFVKNN